MAEVINKLNGELLFGELFITTLDLYIMVGADADSDVATIKTVLPLVEKVCPQTEPNAVAKALALIDKQRTAAINANEEGEIEYVIEASLLLNVHSQTDALAIVWTLVDVMSKLDDITEREAILAVIDLLIQEWVNEG